MSSLGTADENTLRGYRSVGDLTCDLDGTLSTNIGWVLFEVASSDDDTVRGIIGTYNHYATLLLLRTFRAKRPFRMRGVFEDEIAEARAWALDDVVCTAVDLYDVSGFIAFRATALKELD
ncbi:MAG: hypothetical protein ACXVI3_06835 [Halobacteriota archaeon]